jgi:beta-fructofuranosidase
MKTGINIHSVHRLFQFPVLIIGFLLLTGISTAYSQEIARFDFDEVTGTTTTVESISQSPFLIANHFNKPERINGIEGNALRLDGYSTWAYSNTFQFGGINNKMTLSTWYATEAFNQETGAIISQVDANSGFALEVGPYGNVSLVFYADGSKYTLHTNQTIEKYKWNNIVATIDLANAKARIIVNGTEWASSDLNSQNVITLSTARLYLGRHDTEVTHDGFLLTSLNGTIDKIKVFNIIVPDSEIFDDYSAHDTIVPDLTIDPDVRYANDFLRPKFHAMPNACWTNEPYGLIFAGGKYHLFFQKNPNSPSLYFMHWGHLTSPDLVKWTEEKIVLAPSPGFDSFGVWSGTSMLDSSGAPVLVYTGVDGVKAGIGVAFPDDNELISWTKYFNNPVIPTPPSNYQTMDFRDTFIWKSNGYYYMIVGSGILNSGGGIVFLYRSNDLVNWTALSPLFRNVYVSESGYFWEMPFFFPLNANNEFILGVVPIPTQNKPAETIYWIGKWGNEKFTPYFTSPKKFELINGLMLSPAFNTDTSGRITYIGIIPEDRSASAQIQGEWRHTFSLPRQIRLLTDSAVGHIPHPNLCRLRDTLTQVNDRIIESGTAFNLPEFSRKQAELSFKIKADSASRFSIQVFKNNDVQEFTSLVFDLSINKIAFDRAHSSLSSGTPTDYRSNDYIFDYRDTISVDIFLDHSVIEVFVDDLAVYSLRVYPSRIESQNVDLVVAKGKVNIISLDMWKMKNMKDVTSSEVCERTNLPARFRRLGDPLGIDENNSERNLLKLYPNPAKNNLTIEFPYTKNDSVIIEINDCTGKSVFLKKTITNQDKRINVDISGLSPGAYVLSAYIKSGKISHAFVISK